MAMISCEICGGKLQVQPGGNVAVCEDCGMEYSIDRVRELLSNNRSAGKRKSGGSRNTGVSSYVRMAQQAVENKDWKTVCRYCEKIQEVDFTNYQAFLIRGKYCLSTKDSFVWYQNVNQFAIQLAATFYAEAIENAPVGKKQELKEELVRGTISSISNEAIKAEIVLRVIGKYRSIVDQSLFEKLVKQVLTVAFEKNTQEMSDALSRYESESDMNKKAMDADTIVGNASNKVKGLVESVTRELATADINPFAVLLDRLSKELMDAFVQLERIKCFDLNSYKGTSYVPMANFFEMNVYYIRNISTYKEAKAKLMEFRSRLASRVAEIKKQEQRQREEAAKRERLKYLQEHPEEIAQMQNQKIQLEQEETELIVKKRTGTKTIQEEIDKLREKNQEAQAELAACGFFQFREKKEIKDRIYDIGVAIRDKEEQKREFEEDLDSKISEKELAIKNIARYLAGE